MGDLPFQIAAEVVDRGFCRFIASANGERIAVEKYAPGDGKARQRVARQWAEDPRLRNDGQLTVGQVEHALERIELEAMEALNKAEADFCVDAGRRVEVAGYADDEHLAEVAWNIDAGHPDLIVYNRQTREVSRHDEFATGIGRLVVPQISQGLVTPGGHVPGNVLLPTNADPRGADEIALRADLASFIDRYVELPAGATELAVQYVFLSWVHDGFDELPYLGFRTADIGRGKSRALEVVGSVCYRPMFVGGGSSSAATLRMLDVFGGTLVADEFDHHHNTELASDLGKILCQGFQKNRPLVKCDGEDNVPRPFKCFGPKLFALRKQLGDEASESRTLFVRMRQRTRADIPLTLPRQRFDGEALALRNRLLCWRFTRWGRVRVDPTLADPTLEDRANQLALPLLAVARTEVDRTRIREALAAQQRSIADARGDTLAGEVFRSCLAITGVGGIVRPGEVAGQVNRVRAEIAGVAVGELRKPVSPQKVGFVLRDDLELPSDGRDNVGMRYRLTRERVGELAIRFGHPSENSAHSTYSALQPNSTPENPHSQPARGDSCRSVERAELSGDPPPVSTNLHPDFASEPAPAAVPAGWTARSWAAECRRKAQLCQAEHPELARQWLRRAEAAESAAGTL